MDIYSRIDERLREKNMSRRQLAIAAGIPVSSIAASFARKSKKMPLENIRKIANVLDVPINELIGDEAASEALFSMLNGNAPKNIEVPEPPTLREQLEICIGDLNDTGLRILLSVAKNLSDDCHVKWVTEDDI